MRLIDDANFSSLSRDQWEDLCSDLLRAEGHDAIETDGRGGDEGIDAYEGSFDSPTVIYQFKHFKDAFGSSQAQQVKASLEKAHKERSSFKWVLMASANPTPSAARKIEKLSTLYPDVKVEIHYGAEIRQRLYNHRNVLRQFYQDDRTFMMEALDNDGKADFAESFNRKARLFNESIGDERFKASITSDGSAETIAYELQPWVKGPVPILRVTSKTAEAAQALLDNYNRGIDIDLTGSDVDVSFLANIGKSSDGAKLERLYTLPAKYHDDTNLRLFACSGKKTCSLFIQLRTEREGAKECVRSNIHQSNSPIIIRFTFYKSKASDGDATVVNNASCSITPRIAGCRLSSAIKGARFLVLLQKSRALGIGDVDCELNEASFSRFGACNSVDAEGMLTSLMRLKSVYGYFGIDPVLSEEVSTDDFAKGIEPFIKAIKWESEGIHSSPLSITVTPVPTTPNDAYANIERSKDGLAIAGDISLIALGYKLSMRVILRTDNASVHIDQHADGSRIIRIDGRHTYSIVAKHAEADL